MNGGKALQYNVCKCCNWVDIIEYGFVPSDIVLDIVPHVFLIGEITAYALWYKNETTKVNYVCRIQE
jgi:hypothetical protein